MEPVTRMLRLLQRRNVDAPERTDDVAPAPVPKPVEAGNLRKDDLTALVAGCLAGRRDAERTLLLTVAPSMLQMIRRVLGRGDPDVEDTLQEATLNFLHALPSFRATCTIRHFACRVAILTALKCRRGRKRNKVEQPLAEIDIETLGATDECGPGEQALAASRRGILRKLLDALPDVQATALVLHCVGGLSLEEVAAATQAPLETARSRLRLGKAALRARISADPAAADLLEVSS